MLHSQLAKDGYILIKNALDHPQLDGINKTIGADGMVDYTRVKQFIDNTYFTKLNSLLEWKCTYNKFRFSSSSHSNLKDASYFHGDIYHFTHLETIPIYTAVCYLDSATMELIPGTHRGAVHSDMYKNRIQINIHPGDIMIFHANLHHRGIPGNNARRVIQIFEIFSNETDYQTINPHLITVLTNECWPIRMMHKNTYKTNQTKDASDHDSFSLFETIHYWTIVNNIQYSLFGLDIPAESKINKLISYEPGPRDIIHLNQLQRLNINIIVRPHATMAPSCMKFHLLVGSVPAFIIAWVIWKKYKNKSLSYNPSLIRRSIQRSMKSLK